MSTICFDIKRVDENYVCIQHCNTNYFEYGYPVEGLHLVDSVTYYYDGKGNRIRKTLTEGWNQMAGKWYYVEDGLICKDKKEINGVTYEFDRYGRMRANELGMGYYLDDYSYRYQYFDANGRPVTNSWKKVDGSWYYFDANGLNLVGLQTIGGKSYFFNNYGILQE